MEQKIGNFKSSIATLRLNKRTLMENTLILGETGSGKTHLSNKIREFVINSGVPTIYFDFSNPDLDKIEDRFKTSTHFHYMCFDESLEFEKALDEAISEKKDIYMAVNPEFFSSKKELKSQLSEVIQKKELLENYYYFMQVIVKPEGFFTKFEDFVFYIFDIINMKKYGLTFVSQPNEIFENTRIKLLFSFLYLGRCSNAYYYNTAILRNLKPHHFVHQVRLDHRTLLFNPIKTDIVCIDIHE
jgi:DNA helicase HerA-like ATPase